VEITWGALAKADGAAPAWDRSTATCSTVYCHGATLPGGTVTEPVWTKVDGTQAGCGTCHGTPPPWPHPAKTDCTTCHTFTVKPDGTIDVAGGMHINGQVDLDETKLTCISCHGSASNPAPPAGTRGESTTDQHAVGAHQQHLAPSTWHRDGQCADCHAVPQSVTHATGQTTFSWGGVSKAGGANPSYDAGAHTCSSVYCHGATIGGAAGTPLWTKVDGTQAACGTCHGLPPPAPHPQSTSCQGCHPSVITSFTTGSPPSAVWNDKNKHITGHVTY
jgi:predicted CxxxxCH...CXXCH cytochrome family protein